MICKVCQTDLPYEEISQFASYGGLPSPCCKLCVELNDYSINSIEELSAKSLLRRAQTLLNENVSG